MSICLGFRITLRALDDTEDSTDLSICSSFRMEDVARVMDGKSLVDVSWSNKVEDFIQVRRRYVVGDDAVLFHKVVVSSFTTEEETLE
jgi:hypothetical protein